MGKLAHADVVEIVGRYATGWFPLFDERDRFYWERLEERAVLPLDGHAGQAVTRARQIGRRGLKRFDIRFTTAVDEVLRQLQTVRPNSWVKGEVVQIYQALHEAGMLRTVEAWKTVAGEEILVGGLLGIVLPGVFVAETMYGVESEASKACLCRLVEECAAAGYEIIDMQMAHDEDANGIPLGNRGRQHPCVRLGEVRMELEEFLGLMEGAWRRRFDGGAKEWVDLTRSRREMGLQGLW